MVMLSRFDPIVNNISVLSSHPVEKLVAEPFGKFLLPQGSFWGRIVVWIAGKDSFIDLFIRYAPLLVEIAHAFVSDFFGRCLVQKDIFFEKITIKISEIARAPGAFSRAISFTRERFDSFEKYLISDRASMPSKSLLALSFSERWKGRFEKLHHFFGYKGPFPSLVKAQKAIAPYLIESVSGTRIPWESLKVLMQVRTLTDGLRKRLSAWCKDVGRSWEFLSPLLFIRLFEKLHLLPESKYKPSEKGMWLHIFEMTRFLYDMGLVQLLDGEYSQFEWNFRKKSIPIAVENQVLIEFSLNVSLRAYELSDQERKKCFFTYKCECMVLVSCSPLFLGVWSQLKQTIFSILPIQCFLCDSKGRYSVVERLVASLNDDDIWESEKSISTRDKKLLIGITEVVNQLLFKKDFLQPLELHNIFVTPNMELRTVVPEKWKYSTSVFLHSVEQFVVKACRKNRFRIRYVLENGNVFSHNQTRFFRNLLKKWWDSLFWEGADATKRIKIAIRVEAHLCKVSYQEVLDFAFCEWVKELRESIPRIRLEIRKRELDSDFARKNASKWIPEAFLFLQKEIGFVTSIPEEIHMDVVDWIERNKL
jgi:hypothetical protein